jgi:hypothetical protein
VSYSEVGSVSAAKRSLRYVFHFAFAFFFLIFICIHRQSSWFF